MIRLSRTVSKALLACALAFSACVHHPRRAELGISSKQEALERCSQALKRRFANVYWTESDRGLLSTDTRFVEGDALTRCRAYVALSPGEFGWDAEITVVQERLVDRDAADLPVTPHWKFVRCDDALEAYLASECVRPTAPASPFASSEGGAAESAPSSGRAVDRSATDSSPATSASRPKDR